MGKVLTTPTLSPFRLVLPFRETAISLAIAATFTTVALPVEAAGLGRLTVQSALGQPLRAEIEITSLSEEEAGSLAARLARPESFRQAGLEYNPALTGLKFEVIRNGESRSIVKVSSPRAINEPFVDLLVELTWASGKFVREYTFLLDPPELRLGRTESIEGGPAQSTAIVTPSPSALRAPAPATPAGAVAQPTPVAVGVAPATQDASIAERANSLRDRRLATRAPAEVTGSTPSPIGARSPAPASAQAASSTTARPATSPAPTAAPTAATGTARSLPGKRTVQRGETLNTIAGEMTSGSADLNQVMVALYRRNPDAFFGSIHQLRAGAELDVPTAEQMAAVSQAQVLAEIRASNESWREYRARLANVAADSTAPASAAPAGSAAVGNVGAARAPVRQAAGTTDSLKLSRDTTGSVSGATSATGDAAVNTEERGVAREVALRDAQSRVSELERNVADLQKLLELKNQQLADLSGQVGQARSGAEAAAAAAAAAATKVADAQAQARAATEKALADKAAAEKAAEQALADKAAIEKAAAEKIEAARVQAAAAKADTAKAGSSSATTAAGTAGVDSGSVTTGAASTIDKAGDAAAAAGAAVAAAAGSAQAGAEQAGKDVAAAAGDAASAASQAARDMAAEASKAAAAAASSSPPVEATATPSPAPTVQAEPQPAGMLDSVLSTLSSNALVPAGAAGLIALAGFMAWRKRKAKPAEEKFEDTLAGDDAFAANSLFGSTGGHDVDTSNSLFNTTVGADSSVDVHSTEVDPIAEAEVYIAYGREAQAEEILKEALKRSPDRQAIRLKLLEIYAGRKDPIAYGALAREMYDSTGGQNEEWPKVITMGLSIDPENPLYTGDGEVDAGAPVGRMAAMGAAGVAGATSIIDSLSPDTVVRGHASAGTAAFNTVDDDADDLPTLTVDPDARDGVEALRQASAPGPDEQFGSLDFDLDINTEMNTSIGMTTEDGHSGRDSMSHSIEMPTLDFEKDLLAGDSTIVGLNSMSMDGAAGDSGRGSAMAGALQADHLGVGLDLSNDREPAGGESAQWQEMATKLDLASAYEEIGDKEGARELLEEVIKGGDNGQQQKARAMLSKIG